MYEIALQILAPIAATALIALGGAAVRKLTQINDTMATAMKEIGRHRRVLIKHNKRLTNVEQFLDILPRINPSED